MPILQRNKVLLRNVAAAIVEHEQPVTRSFLVRRLTEVAQGKSVALTQAIDSVLGECHKEQPASTLPEYYFTDAATAEAYTSFRSMLCAGCCRRTVRPRVPTCSVPRLC